MSLANLTAHTARGRPDIEYRLFFNRSSCLPQSRNVLANMALEWGANHVLWMDADHTFPPTALIDLLKRDLPIVGVNYGRRGAPRAAAKPVAIALGADDLVWTTAEKAETGEIEEVDSLGFGFLLMTAEALSSVPRPRFAIIAADDTDCVTEDVFFCRKAREAGLSIWVDHALSWEIGHVAETLITNEDTLVSTATRRSRKSAPRRLPR